MVKKEEPDFEDEDAHVLNDDVEDLPELPPIVGRKRKLVKKRVGKRKIKRKSKAGTVKRKRKTTKRKKRKVGAKTTKKGRKVGRVKRPKEEKLKIRQNDDVAVIDEEERAPPTAPRQPSPARPTPSNILDQILFAQEKEFGVVKPKPVEKKKGVPPPKKPKIEVKQEEDGRMSGGYDRPGAPPAGFFNANQFYNGPPQFFPIPPMPMQAHYMHHYDYNNAVPPPPPPPAIKREESPPPPPPPREPKPPMTPPPPPPPRPKEEPQSPGNSREDTPPTTSHGRWSSVEYGRHVEKIVNENYKQLFRNLSRKHYKQVLRMVALTSKARLFSTSQMHSYLLAGYRFYNENQAIEVDGRMTEFDITYHHFPDEPRLMVFEGRVIDKPSTPPPAMASSPVYHHRHPYPEGSCSPEIVTSHWNIDLYEPYAYDSDDSDDSPNHVRIGPRTPPNEPTDPIPGRDYPIYYHEPAVFEAHQQPMVHVEAENQNDGMQVKVEVEAGDQEQVEVEVEKKEKKRRSGDKDKDKLKKERKKKPFSAFGLKNSESPSSVKSSSSDNSSITPRQYRVQRPPRISSANATRPRSRSRSRERTVRRRSPSRPRDRVRDRSRERQRSRDRDRRAGRTDRREEAARSRSRRSPLPLPPRRRSPMDARDIVRGWIPRRERRERRLSDRPLPRRR